jgi:hypothetical protein
MCSDREDIGRGLWCSVLLRWPSPSLVRDSHLHIKPPPRLILRSRHHTISQSSTAALDHHTAPACPPRYLHVARHKRFRPQLQCISPKPSCKFCRTSATETLYQPHPTDLHSSALSTSLHLHRCTLSSLHPQQPIHLPHIPLLTLTAAHSQRLNCPK